LIHWQAATQVTQAIQATEEAQLIQCQLLNDEIVDWLYVNKTKHEKRKTVRLSKISNTPAKKRERLSMSIQRFGNAYRLAAGNHATA